MADLSGLLGRSLGKLSLETAAAALVLASMGMARGKDAGPGAARAGKGLCIAARIIAAVYFICMVLAIIFAAVVFGGIFYYAGSMKY